MLADLDAKVGKTMFHPIIIVVCQMLGWTQYQFSRAAHIIPPMIALYALSGWFTITVFGLALVVRIVNWWVKEPEDESRSDGFNRGISWVLFIFSVVHAIGAVDYQIISMIIFFIITLFAEYACTIKTIPPREEKFTKMATDSIW